jgi:hypothetical protein
MERLFWKRALRRILDRPAELTNFLPSQTELEF